MPMKVLVYVVLRLTIRVGRSSEVKPLRTFVLHTLRVTLLG